MYVSVCRYVMLVIEILIAKVWTVLQSFFRVSLSIKILTKQIVIKSSAKTGHNTRDVLIFVVTGELKHVNFLYFKEAVHL